MFKKGLVTLVCLTVMSALWAWATTTYSISTKINSLGSTSSVVGGKTVYSPIIGGDIKVRGGAAQTTGIKYSNYTTQADIAVVVTPRDGYKISALTATGGAVKELPAVGANQTAALTVTVAKPAPNTTGTAAYVVATFAPATATATVTKNWQLQVQNNTKGGAILIERATNANVTHTALGTLVKSYADTTPVKVTVTPDSGWDIDYLIVNGVKTFYKDNTVRVVNVDPSTGSRIKNVIAGYRKQSLKVTTNTNSYQAPVIAYNADGTLNTGATVTKYVPNGIEPVNPVADPSGTIRLVVTPTPLPAPNNAAVNVVKSIVVTGSYASVSYADRFGKEISGLPYTGPVKVTISGVTSNISVAATYGLDATATAEYASCTQTCHADNGLDPALKATLAAADTEWLGSKHADNPYHTVDCIGCHQTMPGPALTTATCTACHKGPYADPNLSQRHASISNSCFTCHNPHSLEPVVNCATCHTTPLNAAHTAVATCASCHANTHKPTVTSAACATCHGVKTQAELAVDPYNSAIATRFDASKHATSSARGGSCSACHSHEGYVARAGAGKFMGKDELLANYTSASRAVFLLPAGTSTIVGVSKKQCATCHTHDSQLRGMGAEVATGLVPSNGSTLAVDTSRTKYSAEFNLCVDCHSVKLDATFDAAAGYGGRGMFRYTLSSDYTAANLIDGTTGTYNFGKIFYHDGGSGTGRTFVDTHFGGTIASHLVNFDGATTDVTLAGYNIDPGNKNACTICHDPHTAGKLLDVAAGTTVPVDNNSNVAISFATGLGNFHTDYESDVFSRVQTGCTPCHTGSDFPRLTNGATIASLGSAPWSVVGCRSCHDVTQSGDAVRQFPEGYQFKFNATAAAALTATDLGNDATCFECHKGRTAGADVAALPAGETQNYTISYLHYAPAFAIVYGDDSKMVATYAGKEYSGRFQHYDGSKFGCTTCHNVHTGADVMETSTSCNSCHAATSAVSKHNLAERTQKYSERLLDTVLAAMIATPSATDATLAAKLTQLKAETDPAVQKDILMTYIQDRQVKFPSVAIAHAATTWKVFTYEDGPLHGQTHGHGGSWAHNSRFARQMMYDAIESLNGDLTGLVRPAVLSAAAGPHEIAAAIAAENNTAVAKLAVAPADNAVTAACASCHTSANFESSRHANQSARNAACSACHSHEGFVVQSGLGKFNGNDELVAEFNATAYPELFALPASTSTIAGVTKKNCATCHDTENGNALRGAGAETEVEGLIDGTASTVVRTKFSAGFNLCTQCHMVGLDATWDTTEGYDGMGMYKYSLSADYAAENLIDGTTGTYNFSKLFYHDGASGTGRTFVDTHFGGTIASHLVNFDGATTNVTLKGYNINPGSQDACTICHDPHTAGKMLAVDPTTTVAVDDNTNAAISFASGLGDFHTDYLSDVFSRGSVAAQSSSCMPCHSGDVFAAKTEGAAAPTTNQKWAVVGCRSCHNLDKPNSVAAANDAAAFDDVRQFPAGYEFKFNSAAAAVPVADLGDNAVCFECHKGRIAGADVQAMTDPAAGTQNYAISYLHYAPSMAILYGDDSKMVATYAGESYSGRFQHPVEVNGKTDFSCTDCHNVHTGKNVMETASCTGCHDGVTAPTGATLKADVRAFSERLLDTVLTAFLAADGQVGLNAACQLKIDAIQAETDPAVQKDLLMTYIEERQVYFPNKAIAQAAVAWKVFTYEDGPVDGQAHGHGGSWAHNGKFAKQVMYDAIESLGGNVADLTRPAL